MIFKVAWRNIWRSRTRSLVVISAVVLGIWAIIVITGFSIGMVRTYIHTAILNEWSHIQIHRSDYFVDKALEDTLPNGFAIYQNLKNEFPEELLSPRLLVQGMVSSPKAARGVTIKAIQPGPENATTELQDHLSQGQYLDVDSRNPMLIGEDLADKIQVSLNNRVVLTFQSYSGEITAASFRIVGLYKTKDSRYDSQHIFVRQEDIKKLLGGDGLHEIAIRVPDGTDFQPIMDRIVKEYPGLDVQSYKTLSPDLELYESTIGLTSTIMTIIVMLALIFGIINTMMMAVLERIKELGMLMAIGMNKQRVFFMILIETLLLGCIGAPIGMLVGYVTILLTSNTGLDLSAYSAGMREFGLSDIIYPWVPPTIYWQLAIAVVITALIGSLFPALRAIRLRPVEAIRTL
ncbi:MAG: ABC transporter permease [Saprospiraceae bacterium]|nr:ABC transporter permease [Saprospiraceae bacterium]